MKGLMKHLCVNHYWSYLVMTTACAIERVLGWNFNQICPHNALVLELNTVTKANGFRFIFFNSIPRLGSSRVRFRIRLFAKGVFILFFFFFIHPGDTASLQYILYSLHALLTGNLVWVTWFIIDGGFKIQSKNRKKKNKIRHQNT